MFSLSSSPCLIYLLFCKAGNESCHDDRDRMWTGHVWMNLEKNRVVAHCNKVLYRPHERSWIQHFSVKYYIWRWLWLRGELVKLLMPIWILFVVLWYQNWMDSQWMWSYCFQRSLIWCFSEPDWRSSKSWRIFVMSRLHRGLIFVTLCFSLGTLNFVVNNKY